MARVIHAARSRAAWEMAARQHGVVARRDLEGLGFTEDAIEHRLATGRLHPISPGIYAVGRPELTPHGRWMAAVLACGDGAVLSHRSAAELWGIGHEEPGRIEVTVGRRSRLKRRGIKVRCRPSLGAGSVTRRHRIPVTTPVWLCWTYSNGSMRLSALRGSRHGRGRTRNGARPALSG